VTVRDTPITPVALIGMGCRLPGCIDSPELLREAMLRGDDLITEIPADRWDTGEHDDPERRVPGRSLLRWGAVLDDIAGFDPEHRLLLETGYSTRFPTSERSHYARVISSYNECCSDTRSRGCEGGGRGNHGGADRRLGRAHLLSAIRADAARDLSAGCRLDCPHPRRARGGPECR
jgi:Beta-ketoacyl synthase, N-terminal domain